MYSGVTKAVKLSMNVHTQVEAQVIVKEKTAGSQGIILNYLMN